MTSRMHPILEELAAVVAASLMKHPGLTRETAAAAAEHITDALRATYGGDKGIYIPRTKYSVAYMHGEIARRWDGTNTRELCRELGISDSRLRQLARSADYPNLHPKFPALRP